MFINGKRFSEILIKNDQEKCKQIIEMGRNSDYTTGNFLHYEYFWKNYNLFLIELKKQIDIEKLDLKQQISFIGRLENNDRATMFFIIEKSEETTFEFLQMLQQLFDFD